jgi:hypothetical protein
MHIVLFEKETAQTGHSYESMFFTDYNGTTDAMLICVNGP